MSRSPRSGFGLIVLACVAWGCASQSEYPRELYVQRHYIEAEDLFEHMEADLAQLDVAERAEYGTYRGMTLLSLGDFGRAERWLSYATALERSYPRSLTPAQKALLQQGWLRLDAEHTRLARQAPVPVAPETQATLPPDEVDGPQLSEPQGAPVGP